MCSLKASTLQNAWKVATKFLGGTATSPKPALRDMLKSGLITNIDDWFDYIDARNKSSHSNDEGIGAEVQQQIGPFISSARNLLSKI